MPSDKEDAVSTPFLRWSFFVTLEIVAVVWREATARPRAIHANSIRNGQARKERCTHSFGWGVGIGLRGDCHGEHVSTR